MIMRFIRKSIKYFFIILTIPIAILFVLSCCSPYLSSQQFFLSGFLALAFPYLGVLLTFSLLFWLAFKPILSIIPAACLLLGFSSLKKTLSFSLPTTIFKEEKGKNLRIISWNVGSMYGQTNKKERMNIDRMEIVHSIMRLDADIVCLQEFSHSSKQGKYGNNIDLFLEKYPYYYYSKDLNKKDGFYQSGSIIFSKYKIIDSTKIPYPKNISESLIYADILLPTQDTIRVFNIHLQSFKFSQKDYSHIYNLSRHKDATLESSMSLYQKMQTAFLRRNIQANIIQAEKSKTNKKYILCGDFNDVPTSYTYHTIKGDSKDSFLEKSWGLGRTFSSLAPTLRIDYILVDQRFSVEQFHTFDDDLSDHYLLVSDIYPTRP